MNKIKNYINGNITCDLQIILTLLILQRVKKFLIVLSNKKILIMLSIHHLKAN